MIYKIIHATIVVLAYTGAVLYLLHRLQQVFPDARKKILHGLVWLMSAFFVAVQYLRIGDFGRAFLPWQCASYLWMTVVFYLFFFILAGDLLALLVRRVRPLWQRLQPRMAKLRKGYCFFSIGCAVLLLGYGLVHFTHPKVVHLDIDVAQPAPDWNIVLVSDLHLGTMTPKLLQKHVETINALHPDLVLMAGDQFVLKQKDVVEMGYADILRKIQAPKGVYAVNGNHETHHGYLRPENRADDFYRSMNICLLSDTALVIDGQLALIGRIDSTRSFRRRNLDELTENLPENVPVILLDHQPEDLRAAQRCGIDLQLSGHTHNGQLFPMNLWQWGTCLLTGKLHHGYRKVGNTQYYVTAGLGGSGEPVRVGTTGEIVLIKLK